MKAQAEIITEGAGIVDTEEPRRLRHPFATDQLRRDIAVFWPLRHDPYIRMCLGQTLRRTKSRGAGL